MNHTLQRPPGFSLNDQERMYVLILTPERPRCSLGHTKVRCIALLNFLLTIASFPDARKEKRFSAEQVIAAIFGLGKR